MNKIIKLLSLTIFTIVLVGCGGSFNSNSSGGGGGGTVTVALGSGNGSSFQPGVLALSSTSLSAGGSTTVTATLQNSDGTAYTQSATITFNSPCYQNGLAVFTVAGAPTNKVPTSTGLASITYAANGCSGSDIITATITVGSSNLSATGTVTVAAPNIGSIQFISATPTTISLKGVGGTETSTVVFKVVDSTGGPVPGASVSFTLNSNAGGLSLSPASGTTGNDGSVQTVVQAGTVPTTVRVTATVTTASGQISTQSSALIVSTGFPTENGFSLSVATFNTETGTTDGVKDAITARLVDNFGNPVPDGTAVSFVTTGGAIQPGCTTTGGACTVNWTSQDPRPLPGGGSPAVTYHAEILAFAIGEESWTDTNSNGFFDPTDTFSVYPGAPATGDNFFTTPAYNDIGELYIDQDESGSFKSGDFYNDFNHDGKRNPPDGLYHGAGCVGNGTIACSPSSSIAVGRQTCIIMSTSQLVITGPAHVPANSVATFLVSDLNGNVPPAGTTIALASGGTVNPTILNKTVPNITCSGSVPPNASYAVNVAVPAAATGFFVLTATTPSGLQSQSGQISVP